MPNKNYDIAIDFDGVLHEWDGEWRGADCIDGEPIEGSIEWLNELTENEVTFCIFSGRNNCESGPEAVYAWLKSHGMQQELSVEEDFPCRKPNANIMIDDHGMQFTGIYPSAGEVKDFKTWQGGVQHHDFEPSPTPRHR